ncbi:F0F1 ATP synthase subunit A [Streptomyces sp. NPDC059506]|uniref:ATP synthase subunit a n=1 Tax=Streptomyces thermolineatus TaxID=44033 RepID=A0ABN3KUW2_9ACTN|nr:MULTISPECIES: F0F1 ATP synthase subunit A [unclassified Streptomyces]MCZ2524245.1 F0F1 ATP synthase subunit A [Streptomyces sp. HB2AG]PLW71101.1 ATP synthase F0 subunit A [Streptomyces sp. DJ]QMV21731.1 F0F1 ATP synthase subunit A [Streptomyces sp. SCUT-3]
MEHTLNALALTQTPLAAGGDGEFHTPSISEFFPDAVLFEGTVFELNRIRIALVLVTLVIAALFAIAMRNPQRVPRGGQNVAETAIDFVRNSIALETLGRVKGTRYLPYLVTLFFFVLGANILAIVPGVNIAASSTIGLPFLLAMITWAIYHVDGVREHGLFGYIKVQTVVPGVPKALAPVVILLEALQALIIRPFSLMLRLLANMMAGHILLVLFFSGASYLLLHGGGLLPVAGAGSAVMGLAFTGFELFVAALQAYIFTLLTAMYINMAISHEH